MHMPCTCCTLLLRAPHAQAVPLRRHLSVPLRLLLCPAPLHPSERLELLRLGDDLLEHAEDTTGTALLLVRA